MTMTRLRNTAFLLALLAWPSSAVAQGWICDRSAVVNIATATTAELVPVPTGKSVVICGFVLNAGHGLSVVTGTDPAANTEVSETVPANGRWRVLAMRVSLVTDATVANREVSLQFDDGTTAFFAAAANANQAASLTRQYSVGTAGERGAAATATDILIPAPSDVVLLAGHRVRTSTTNRQAGDNFGAPTLLVQESASFKFVSGTGTDCGTGQANLSGPFEVAPFGLLPVSGTGAVMKASLGHAVCLTNNRPVQLSGTVIYGVF
jgi:hypothetical protein